MKCTKLGITHQPRVDLSFTKKDRVRVVAAIYVLLLLFQTHHASEFQVFSKHQVDTRGNPSCESENYIDPRLSYA